MSDWRKLTSMIGQPVFVNLDHAFSIHIGEYWQCGITSTRIFSSAVSHAADLGTGSVEFNYVDVRETPEQILANGDSQAEAAWKATGSDLSRAHA